MVTQFPYMGMLRALASSEEAIRPRPAQPASQADPGRELPRLGEGAAGPAVQAQQGRAGAGNRPPRSISIFDSKFSPELIVPK